MKKATLLLASLLLMSTAMLAQEVEAVEEESDAGLQISGSVDTYYKYDFSGNANIPTSFADVQNSVSIGMLDVALSQSVGKASFVGEFSFGPRSFKSLPFLDDGSGESRPINIQNLYVSYALSDKVSLTAGYMGTFVGYEVISPAGNFNYSTSYLFTSGPFQNSGLKLDWSIADNFGLMVGVFNDWNVYQDTTGVTDFGAQLYWAPLDGWDIYLNFLTGSPSGMVVDLTTGYQIVDKFYLGLNFADYGADNSDDGGYTGVALYPQFSFNDKLALGYRGEWFNIKEVKTEIGAIPSSSIFANTLTLNYYNGPLTFSTEWRLDSASEEFFVDGDAAATKSASQILLAAIFAF